MAKSSIKKIPQADLIRVIAMLMVILLHTILNFTIRPDFFATKLYFLLEPIVAISKTCVLLFFMLSGFLVITKQKPVSDNLLKTWHKIIVPLSFFTLLNLLIAWQKFTQNEGDFLGFVTAQIQRMLSFPSSPLWFLVVLVFLYLLNPLWQLVFDQRQDQNRHLARFLTLIALVFTLSTTLTEHLLEPQIKIFNNFTAWTGFLFFYLYGGLVRNQWIEISKQKTNLIMITVGVILTIIGDVLTMWQNTHGMPFILHDYTSAYQSIPVTLTAIGLFNHLIQVDLRQVKNQTKKTVNALIAWLAELSFGIYLLHPYLIGFLLDVGFDFNKLHINVYLFNLLNFCLVLVTSILLVMTYKFIVSFLKGRAKMLF